MLQGKFLKFEYFEKNTSCCTTQEARARFKCDHCSKSFPFRSEREMHSKCHSQSHPFKCGFCPAEIKLKSDLTRHSKWHNRLSLHCDYDGCSYSTKEERYLYEHIRGKHSKALYKCPKRGCQYSSSFCSGIRYHLVNVHNEKKKVHLKDKAKKKLSNRNRLEMTFSQKNKLNSLKV